MTDIRKTMPKVLVAIFLLLFAVCCGILLYANSGFHPSQISDSTAAKKGEVFTVRLTGVSGCDSEGFYILAENFYISDGTFFVGTGEDGYAVICDDGENAARVNGKYSARFIRFDDYNFCSDIYGSKEALCDFFETPDIIYNFDINNLSEYVSDILQYEKKFNGSAVISIYRGKLVFTEIYIGDEKVLELKI